MPEIPLKGLPADSLPAALSSFGLYSVVEGCRLRFECEQEQSYYPVLISDFDSIESLSDYLADPKTWSRLCDNHEEFLSLTVGGLSREVFKDFYGSAPDVASGILTDGSLGRPNNNKTPFFCFIRHASVHTTANYILSLLTAERVLRTLTNHNDWFWVASGQTLGLFPEFDIGMAFENPIVIEPKEKGKKSPKNQEKQDEGSGRKKIVPLLGLLSMASWSLFPVYPSGDKASAIGFHGIDFYYPVFSKPLDQAGFTSLMMNSQLRKFKYHRKGFQSMGVSAVYKASKKPKQGQYDDPYFLPPTIL